MDTIPIAGGSLHYDDNEDEEQTTAMDIDSDSEKTESDSDDTADSKRVDDPFRALSAFATMARVYGASNVYKNIVKGFESGMGSAAGATEVMAVHVPRYANQFSGEARMAMFEKFTEAVGRQCGRCREHAVRFGCYFGSKEEIARIVAHGFSSLNGDEFGRIVLFPMKYALDGAKRARVDEDGMRHVVMCRVIMGKVEELPSGSMQDKPSSDAFDCGVDCVADPRRFYVWSNCMNSHILPANVVSFRAPERLEGYVNNVALYAAGTASTSRVVNASGTQPHIPIATLEFVLKRFLTPEEMKIAVTVLEEFKAKKFNSAELNRKMQLIAGDRWLSAAKLASTTASSTLRGLPQTQVANSSPRDKCFNCLIVALAELLPAHKSEMLKTSYGEYLENKNRPELIKTIKDIVGNDNQMFQAFNRWKIRNPCPHGKQKQPAKKC